MALLHRATLQPTKIELLAGWLPAQPWHGDPAGALERVASCRFDDPAGEVGIETILVRTGAGPVHHVPLTYRGAPLPGGDEWLIGTAQHSVLGRRWVYDACGDPVYAAVLADAIVTGAGQAVAYLDVDGRPERRESDLTVTGSGVAGAEPPTVTAIDRVVAGDPTLVVTDSIALAVVRRPGGDADVGEATLTGAWADRPAVVLAYVTRR